MKKPLVIFMLLYFILLLSIVLVDNFIPTKTYSYSGSGSIWVMGKGDFIAKNFNGDSLGLEAARAYCVGKGGGMIQMGPGTETIGIRPGIEPNILLLKSFMTGWLAVPTSIIDVAVLDTLNFRSVRGDTARVNYLTGKLSNSAVMTHLGNVVINDSLRINKLTEVIGKVIIGDSLRVNKSTEVIGKETIGDSLRVNKTSELIGDVTIQGKAVIDDSLRVTGPTHLASSITLGNGSNLFMSDATGGLDLFIDRENASSISLRLPDSGTSGTIQITTNNGSNALFQVLSDGRAVIRQGSAYASFSGVGAFDGTIIYCTDCTKATPCAAGGSGAFAFRINGAWECNP